MEPSGIFSLLILVVVLVELVHNDRLADNFHNMVAADADTVRVDTVALHVANR